MDSARVTWILLATSRTPQVSDPQPTDRASIIVSTEAESKD